jgi:gp16 family phage-associated protein
MRKKTGKQVRREFIEQGQPISAWARAHGFKSNDVFEVLAGRNQGLRGKAHQIAILLGMKRGKVIASSE